MGNPAPPETLPPPQTPKSVLIADDHEAVRWAVRAVLEQNGYRVCGEAVDGVDALEKTEQLAPDLVVLDLKMPKLNGIETATLLRHRFPAVPIVLLTLYEVGQSIASTAGINSVVTKPDGIKNLPLEVKKLLDPPPPVSTIVISSG